MGATIREGYVNLSTWEVILDVFGGYAWIFNQLLRFTVYTRQPDQPARNSY